LLPLFSLLAGLSVAMSARQQIRRGARLLREPYLVGLLLFEIFVVVPVGLYLFLSQPAWSMLYMIDAEELSSGILITVLVGSPIAAAIAYTLGYFLCLKKKYFVNLVLAAFFSCAILVMFFSAGERFSRLATDGDWQRASGILASNLGVIFAFIVPVVLGGWIFLMVLFAMEGRKIIRSRIGTIRAESGPQAVPGETPAYPDSLLSAERNFFDGSNDQSPAEDSSAEDDSDSAQGEKASGEESGNDSPEEKQESLDADSEEGRTTGTPAKG